jgi:hypothetical protein
VSEHPYDEDPSEPDHFRPVDPVDPEEVDQEEADRPTGHPDVDDVVASLRDLDGRPVSEHVAVFEAAHDRLRGALADAGDDPSGS